MLNAYVMTDDPLHDFFEDDRRKQEWLKGRPVCAACGEPIQEEMAYMIAGEYYCEACVRAARTYMPEE